MRTTIEVRPDLYRKLSEIALGSGRSLDDTANDCLARSLATVARPTVTTSAVTGFLVTRLVAS